METYFDYLCVMAPMLGERIVQTYPALQSPKDPPTAQLKTLLRKPLPAQALAITGLAKYLKTARSTRIVAECGAGKTFMSLGTMRLDSVNAACRAVNAIHCFLTIKITERRENRLARSKCNPLLWLPCRTPGLAVFRDMIDH